MWIACRIPPYFEDSHGLLTGTSYDPFREPPTDIPILSIDATLLYWEFAYIGLTLFTALTALRSGAKQRQKTFLFCGLAIEMGAFLCCLPQMSSLFMPQCTWLLMNVLAALAIFFVLYAGRNTAQRKRRIRP